MLKSFFSIPGAATCTSKLSSFSLIFTEGRVVFVEENFPLSQFKSSRPHIVEGGDQINAILTFLILPVTLCDSRIFGWKNKGRD
ncbi:hypothetical protein [Flavobacterium alkalisoli]|uniref:hypothetical protein n=1 Tax=Flavobacterium alkalisoli TaxID=2602769 RepID=UPI001F0D05C4|nr:hypothetical protein [Flavobacterium alkalisoli]